jgi:tyrosyl-tRNA synthetase
VVSSKSEGRRLIQQGAVEVDGQKIADLNHQLRVGQSYDVRVGKRRFTKIHLRPRGGPHA